MASLKKHEIELIEILLHHPVYYIDLLIKYEDIAKKIGGQTTYGMRFWPRDSWLKIGQDEMRIIRDGSTVYLWDRDQPLKYIYNTRGDGLTTKTWNIAIISGAPRGAQLTPLTRPFGLVNRSWWLFSPSPQTGLKSLYWKLLKKNSKMTPRKAYRSLNSIITVPVSLAKGTFVYFREAFEFAFASLDDPVKHLLLRNAKTADAFWILNKIDNSLQQNIYSLYPGKIPEEILLDN
jgi:hypothetical protein